MWKCICRIHSQEWSCWVMGIFICSFEWLLPRTILRLAPVHTIISNTLEACFSASLPTEHVISFLKVSVSLLGKKGIELFYFAFIFYCEWGGLSTGLWAVCISFSLTVCSYSFPLFWPDHWSSYRWCGQIYPSFLLWLLHLQLQLGSIFQNYKGILPGVLLLLESNFFSNKTKYPNRLSLKFILNYESNFSPLNSYQFQYHLLHNLSFTHWFEMLPLPYAELLFAFGSSFGFIILIHWPDFLFF